MVEYQVNEPLSVLRSRNLKKSAYFLQVVIRIHRGLQSVPEDSKLLLVFENWAKLYFWVSLDSSLYFRVIFSQAVSKVIR